MAQRLGAATGLVLGLAWVGSRLLAPPRCPGALFLELRPPLAAPGPYRIKLAYGDSPEGAAEDWHHCEFSVSLPQEGPVDVAACGAALDLMLDGQGPDLRIAGLTLGVAPTRLSLQVEKGEERIYDTILAPSYAGYPVSRAESPRFCGPRATVTPPCLRGTSQCAPYPASCIGRRACPSPKICCVHPDWGREHGVAAAARCSSRRTCQDALAFMACEGDRDCPEDQSCGMADFSLDFKPKVRVCQSPSQRR